MKMFDERWTEDDVWINVPVARCRSRLCQGLSAWYGEPEARRRWPRLFVAHETTTMMDDDGGYWTLKAKFSKARLASELDAIPPPVGGVDATVTASRLVRMLRENVAAPVDALGRRFMDPAFASIPAYERAFMLLRWGTDDEALALFRAMAEEGRSRQGGRGGGPRTAHRMLRCFYELCVLLQPGGALRARLRTVQPGLLLRKHEPTP